MTPDEIKSALADRGLTDAMVRIDYSGERYRITAERIHNDRSHSHSMICDMTPAKSDLDAIAHAFKQWWDEERA